MDLRIAGKTALVTGGARGIGRAAAEHLSAEGARIAVADLDPSGLPAAWLGVACDMSDPDQIDAMVTQVVAELGDVDILISNAGVFSGTRLGEHTVEDWDRIFRVNLTGAFLLCQRVLPGMTERGWGRIVVVSSMAGKVGGLVASPAYSASKAGLLSLTKSVAREGAPGVTANAVAPAFIDTAMLPPDLSGDVIDQIPAGRLGTADEVAAAVAYLASDLAGFITGEVLDINGGLLMD